MADNKKKITLTLTPDNIEMLKEYAEKQGVSVSTVVQLMVNKAFKKGGMAV